MRTRNQHVHINSFPTGAKRYLSILLLAQVELEAFKLASLLADRDTIVVRLQLQVHI